jgi:hypothetical protein
MLCFTRRIARSRPPHRQSVPILSFFCITALYRDMQLTAASPPVRCPSNCRHPLPDPCAATTSPDPCAAATSSDSRIAATLPRHVPQSRPRQQPPCAACVRRAPPRVVAALLRATSSSRAPPSGSAPPRASSFSGGCAPPRPLLPSVIHCCSVPDAGSRCRRCCNARSLLRGGDVYCSAVFLEVRLWPAICEYTSEYMSSFTRICIFCYHRSMFLLHS